MEREEYFQPEDFWQVEGDALAPLTDQLGLERVVRRDSPTLASVTYAGEQLAVCVTLDVRDQHLEAWIVPASVDESVMRSPYELSRALDMPDPPPRPAPGRRDRAPAPLPREYARALLEWIAGTVASGWATWNEAPESLFPRPTAAPSVDPMRGALTAANEAFGESNFARVVALLSRFEDTLSKVDAARLRYARSQIRPSPGASWGRGPALRRFLLGIGGWVLGGLGFYALRASGYEPKGRLASGVLIALAVPGSLALVGLLELATGRSFASLARAWDELAGWQQGVISLAVCVAAFAAMIGVVAFVFGDWSQ